MGTTLAGMLRSMSAPSDAGAPIVHLRIDLALRAIGICLVALAIGPFVDQIVHGFQLINWQAVGGYPVGTTGHVGGWLGGLAAQFSPSGIAGWLLDALPWILGVAAGIALVHRPPGKAHRFLSARFA